MIAARDRGDGAVRDARRDHLDIGRFQPPCHLLRQERGRQIDVGHGQTQQSVANSATHDLHGAAIAVQRSNDPAQTGAVAPFGGRQRRHRCHPAGRRRARLTMIPAVTPQIRRPCQSMS